MRKFSKSLLFSSSLLVLALSLAAPAQAQLFAGTSLNPTGSNHPAYLIDVITGTPTMVFNEPVGGATFDPVGNRVLFTTSSGSSAIDQLWEWPVGAVAPNALGTLVDSGDSLPRRMDGLAMSNGVLYGSRAAGIEDGIWTIDLGTLEATLVYPFPDSVSGIDADPDTGIIYGVNDSTETLVSIDPVGMTMTTITPYPAGETDIDGLAIGDGRAYFAPDEPGSIYVYDLAGGVFETPLPNPWTSADTFSGAAFIFDPPPPPPLRAPGPPATVPALGPLGLAILAALVGLLGIRRQRPA